MIPTNWLGTIVKLVHPDYGVPFRQDVVANWIEGLVAPRISSGSQLDVDRGRSRLED